MSRYKPLFIILAVIVAGSYAMALPVLNLAEAWMQYFMGLFFLIFALFKLIDVEGFAKGFAKYDLIASRFPLYGRIYPYLELLLALAYLAFLSPAFIAAATFVLMSISAAGVFLALRKGLDTRCACLGTVLDVPLSTVSVVENVGMALMAAIMFIMWG